MEVKNVCVIKILNRYKMKEEMWVAICINSMFYQSLQRIM